MKSHLPPHAQENRLIAQPLKDELPAYNLYRDRARGKNVIAPLIVLMAILMSTPAWAVNVTVANTNDGGSGSLRDAIANAAAGDTIDFAVRGAITLTSGELLIDKDLTISGPGAAHLTIQRSTDGGTQDFRIFEVVSGMVTISGLTISNGRADFGGGIFNWDNLALNACTILGNFATDLGGGIGNSGTMTMSNCVVSGNSVAGGSNIDALGGGVFNDGTLTASSCIVSSNSVRADTGRYGLGGGVFNDGTMAADKWTVSDNSAQSGAGADCFGGGVYNTFAGNLTFTNRSMIIGNFATGGAGAAGGGGGIFNDGTLKLIATTVGSNSANGGDGDSPGAGYGGGVANGYGEVTLDRSTVNGNLAVGGGGSSGSSAGGGISNDFGTVYVYSSTVSGNVLSGGTVAGGGIFNLSASIIVAHSTITANVVPGGFPEDGGGIYSSEGGVDLWNTIVAANSATVDVFNGEFSFLDSFGFNLIGAAAGPFTPGPGDQSNITAAALKLGPLQDNGGPTFTHALPCGSPAIDAGDNTNAPATDQRGFARVVNSVIDIGAFESGNTAPTISSCPTPVTLSCASSNGVPLSVDVADADGNPLTVVWTVDGTPTQSTVVPASGPPSSAKAVFTALYGPGVHKVTVSVSDPGGCVASCSTTVTVGTASGGCVAPAARACSLGQANGYAVFMMGNVAGTRSVISEGTTRITGNVAVGPSATGSSVDFAMSTIDGKLFKDPAANLVIHPDLTVTGGVVTPNLTTARNNALAASACYAALPPTQTLNNITGSTTLPGNGGLNVINVGPIVLVKSVLTLYGGANDIFIINASSVFSMDASQVVLAGGVTAGHVLWNVPGDGPAVKLYKNSTSVSGTLLVPYRDYVQENATLNGSVLAGGNVSIHSGAKVICSSGACTP